MSSERERKIRRVTIVGSIGNLLLMAFKFVAGILGNSAAMMADALHSLTDFVTDILVIAFVRLAGKPQDADHEYGHGKYETLASSLIGLSLLGVGIYMLAESSHRIWHVINGEILPKPGSIALIAALVSLAVKEGLYWYTMINGRRMESPAVMANAWHHRSDALSSIATLIGIGGAILLGNRWTVLDPIAAAIVSLIIIKVSVDLMRQSVGDLLDHSLPREVEEGIIRRVLEEPEVSDPHNLRTRRVGTRKDVDIHVRMPGDMSVERSHQATKRIESRLRELLGSDTIISIHVEPIKEPKK